MIPSPESNQDVNTALFLMASLSPAVREAIDLELYRASADSDEASDQYILETAFTNLMRDIETIGLTFNTDFGYTTDELGKLFDFIHFVSYLLPNSLYDILKKNIRIKTCVGHILSGTLGENETLIQTYLSELGGLDGQDPLVEECRDIADTLYPVIKQTDTFTDYLLNLYDLAIHEKLVIESDPETHSTYRDMLKVMIGKMSDAVNLFTNHPFYGELCRIQDLVIKDLVSPANFIDYNYLFVVRKNSLPEDLIPLHDRRLYHYKVSHNWCLEYYALRNLIPSDVQIMMLYCFAFALAKDKDDYAQIIKGLRDSYPKPEYEVPIVNLF